MQLNFRLCPETGRFAVDASLIDLGCGYNGRGINPNCSSQTNTLEMGRCMGTNFHMAPEQYKRGTVRLLNCDLSLVGHMVERSSTCVSMTK